MKFRHCILIVFVLGISVFVFKALYDQKMTTSTESRSPASSKAVRVQKKPKRGSVKPSDKASNVNKILVESRSMRESEGATSTDLLWYVRTEKELLAWAEHIHAAIAERFDTADAQIIVLLGLEGTGDGRYTVYVFKKTTEGNIWRLVLLLPTNHTSFKVLLANQSGVLAVKSTDGTLLATYNTKL